MRPGTTLTPPAYEIPLVLLSRLSMMLLRRAAVSVEIPGGIPPPTPPFIEMKHRVEVFWPRSGNPNRRLPTRYSPPRTVVSLPTGSHTGSYTTPASVAPTASSPCVWARESVHPHQQVQPAADSKSNQIFRRNTPSPSTTLQASSSTPALYANPGEPDAVPTPVQHRNWTPPLCCDPGPGTDDKIHPPDPAPGLLGR